MMSEMGEMNIGAEMVREEIQGLACYQGSQTLDQSLMMMLIAELRDMNVHLSNIDLDLRKGDCY